MQIAERCIKYTLAPFLKDSRCGWTLLVRFHCWAHPWCTAVVFFADKIQPSISPEGNFLSLCVSVGLARTSQLEHKRLLPPFAPAITAPSTHPREDCSCKTKFEHPTSSWAVTVREKGKRVPSWATHEMQTALRKGGIHFAKCRYFRVSKRSKSLERNFCF